MISLKASEIYQGRGDLKGQSPEKRGSTKSETRSQHIFSPLRHFPRGQAERGVKEAEDVRTFGGPMELGRQKPRPDLWKGEGPDKYSRFSFVTPKGVDPSH